MNDQFKNLMIGIFVAAGAGLVIFVLMFIHPHLGDEAKTVHVRFTDIDKVTQGTRVTYAGRPVGEVVNIQEIEQGRGGPKDANGHVYLYDLTLKIDSGVDIYNTDKITARTSGLLGEKNVEITPFAPAKGQVLIKIDADPMYAQQVTSIEDTLSGINEVAKKFQVTLDAATEVIHRVRDEKLVEKITRTVENIESISAALDKPKELSRIITNVHHLTNRMVNTWENVDNTVKKIGNTADNFSLTSDDARNLLAQISRGEGTLGKLLTRDETYLRFNSIMSKLETTLDDVNHYGLMFQSDKGWQRLRARRLNMLQKLSTPQEFRNYFNDEVDQISTSISRVYMVLNEIGEDPCSCNLMNNNEYTKVFAELMRRISMLEEEVRLYNIQAVEPAVHETELGDGSYCQ